MTPKLLTLSLIGVSLAWMPGPAASVTIDFGDELFSESSAFSGYLLPWVEDGFAVYDLNNPTFTTAASIGKTAVPGDEPRLRLGQTVTVRIEQLGPPLGSDALGSFDLLSLDSENTAFADGATLKLITSKGGMADIAAESTHLFAGPLFQQVTFFDIVLGGSGVAFLDNFVVNPTVPNPVPIPAAAWLFGTALMGLIGLRSRYGLRR